MADSESDRTAERQGAPLPETYRRSYVRSVPPSNEGTANLADILERVLDKGLIIAGDIQINLVDVELLTIKLRLLIASVDRAKAMGINWWESDPTLSRGANQLERENRELRERLERLERALGTGEGEDDGEGQRTKSTRGTTRGARR